MSSDTTSLTLTYLFYELGKHPEHITRIREEVEQASANGAPPTHQELQALPHLNGVINETLRLHPVVPTALQRLTPPEGITIGATFVPGNTVVWCPQYSIARSKPFLTRPLPVTLPFYASLQLDAASFCTC